MAADSFDTSKGFRAYPTNRVVAILDSPQAAEGARKDLVAAGVAADTIEFACGQEGLKAIDFSGKDSGVIARMMRAIQQIGELAAYWKNYEKALQDGKCLLAVDAEDDSVRKLAHEKIKARGGRYINFFGKLGLEKLEP
jgi:hypothetical protein